MEEAAEAFRAMARSRVAPTLRSRAALVEALLRLRSGGGDKSGGGGKGGGGRAPPGAESFWRALPFPRDEALASFRASGVGVADVADLLLEAPLRPPPGSGSCALAVLPPHQFSRH